MFETFRGRIFRPPTSSAAGSPVNLFRTLVDGKVVTIQGGSGRRWPAWWMRYDPESSLWKTSRVCTPQEVPRFSLILPRWGLMRNGVLFLRKTPEPLIFENGSGSWPTMTRSDARGHGYTYDKGNKEMPRLSLVGKARWPTPNATDYKGAGKQTVRGHGGNDLPTAVAGSETQPKGLNPEWVEWLMGFPTGWTDLEH